MATVSLCELLGSTVYDASGAASGRVREVAIAPQEDRSRVSSLIVKTSAGNRVLPLTAVSAINGGIRASTTAAEWASADGSEGLLLLSRDLLDQQVIDVHGRKVVRVNDVDFYRDIAQKHAVLKVEGVDVGARGAVRRLLKGLPKEPVDRIAARFGASCIPWDFVDLIDRDPERLARMPLEDYMRLGGNEGAEVIMWLIMRGALAPWAKKIHQSYYLPMTTAMAVALFE